MPLPALLTRSTVCAHPCPRPGVYREYMRDLCDRVSTAQSHNIHKLVRPLHGWGAGCLPAVMRGCAALVRCRLRHRR